jgi:hypothetical protein
MRQTIGAHETAVRSAAHETGFLRAKHNPTYGGMDTVGTHQCIDRDPPAILELGVDVSAVIGARHEAMSEMDVRRRQRLREDRHEVRAMNLVMRCAEGSLHDLREWRAKKRSSVVPASLMYGQRLHACACERLSEACSMQNARRIGADLDSGADLSEDGRLLVHVSIDPCPQER